MTDVDDISGRGGEEVLVLARRYLWWRFGALASRQMGFVHVEAKLAQGKDSPSSLTQQ